MASATAETTPAPAVTATVGPAALALAKRELVRFFRQKNRLFGALGQPIIFWLLFSEGFASSEMASGLDRIHFFPGTLVMILLFTAIFATISIIEDRREGFLQAALVSPAPRWAIVLGKVAGGAAIAVIQGLIFLLLGWLTLDLAITPPHAAAAVMLMTAIAVALTGLGFTIAWRMDSTHGFHAIMSVFLLPMWLLSGAFFPPGGDGWLSWIVRLNPLTYGVAGMRRYLQYDRMSESTLASLPSISTCWIVTILFAALMLLASWKIADTRTAGDLI